MLVKTAQNTLFLKLKAHLIGEIGILILKAFGGRLEEHIYGGKASTIQSQDHYHFVFSYCGNFPCRNLCLFQKLQHSC